WPKGADCKSAGTAFDGSNPSPSTIFSLIGKSKSQLIELAFFVSEHVIESPVLSGQKLKTLLSNTNLEN
ncbi:hypothetical protein, partial [uncultured Vibrio sp.]|uniref:hypothetical protein n=1 Tax=uncultured Vibrio sp. TaxID=114054 RepID=UPI00262B6EB1